MKSRRTLGRRMFLRGAAGSAVAIPMLASLGPRGARAQQQGPRRLVTVYTANGLHADHWMSRGSGADFTLSEQLSSLTPFQHKLNVLHNVFGDSGHHSGHTEVLTGRPSHETFTPTGGPSLDQALAQTQRAHTPMASLELGVRTGNGPTGVISYSADGLAIPSLDDPRGGFERLLRTAQTDPAELARRQRAGQSVLDAVFSDYSAIQARLSTEDRRLLDAHLTLLREQEQRLQSPPQVAACELGPSPVAADGLEFTFPEATQLHMDTIAHAFRCDLTRVATPTLGASGHTTRYTWAGVDDDFHEVAHGATSDAESKFMAINRWHAEQVAYLLEQLDSIPEGDGSVLDNTVVFWTNELGLSRFSHGRQSMGLLLAGGGNGLLSAGGLRDMAGAHYHDVLLTLGRAVGLDDLQTFGDEGRNVLTELLP